MSSFPAHKYHCDRCGVDLGRCDECAIDFERERIATLVADEERPMPPGTRTALLANIWEGKNK